MRLQEGRGGVRFRVGAGIWMRCVHVMHGVLLWALGNCDCDSDLFNCDCDWHLKCNCNCDCVRSCNCDCFYCDFFNCDIDWDFNCNCVSSNCD